MHPTAEPASSLAGLKRCRRASITSHSTIPISGTGDGMCPKEGAYSGRLFDHRSTAGSDEIDQFPQKGTLGQDQKQGV